MIVRDTSQKVPRLMFAVATALGVMFGVVHSAAPAQAQTDGNVVVFGDSFIASPNDLLNKVHNTSHRYTNSSLSSVASNSSLVSQSSQASNSSLSSLPSNGSSLPAAYFPNRGGCLQHTENWPRQFAKITGHEVVDWSCSGQTSQTMVPRIDEAIEAGDLNEDTQVVFIAVGGNDFGPIGADQGFKRWNIPWMRNAFSNNMAEAAEKIRAVAPDARIIVSGLPEITNGYWVCVFNVIPNVPLGFPVPGRLMETMLRDLHRDGAHANGMEFVDNYEMTAGHNTCAPDIDRYISGMIDTTSPGRTMPIHPTTAGHEAIARNNAAIL